MDDLTFKKWFIKYLSPVLISVLLTGVLTLFIAYRVENAKEDKELESLKQNIFFELSTIKHDVDSKQKLDIAENGFYSTHLLNGFSIDNKFTQLDKILPDNDIDQLILIYYHCKHLDELYDQYFQAKLNDDSLENSIRKGYIEYLNEKDFQESLKYIPTIQKDLGY